MELHHSSEDKHSGSSESTILAQYLIHTLSTPNTSKKIELIEWSKPLSKKELEEVNERLKRIELNPIFLKSYVPTPPPPPPPLVADTKSDEEVTTNDNSDDSEKDDHSSLVTQLVTSNTLASEKILSKLDDEQKIKLKLVKESVEEFDIEKLREHCLTKGGLVHNSIRRAAWQVLLKNSFNHKRKPKVSKHKDESQVGLDAKRSFNSFPKNLSSEKRVIKQTELNSLIKNVLRREPRLNYYQGFHDIASVLLLILDSKTAVGCLQNLSIYFLRDYLGSTLAPVIRQIGLVLSLIRAKDPELSRFLNENQVQPYFCLSWLLTWCSHDIPDLTHLARLFDVLLVSNPSLIIYFVCAVNLNRREEILQLEDDPALIHTYLKQFPEKYDIEELIQKALDLYNEYPIGKLQKDSKFDLLDYSVCNTFESSWNQIHDEASYRAQYAEAQQLIKVLAKRKDTPPDISPCGMPGSDACANPKAEKPPASSKIPSSSFNSTTAALAVSAVLIAGASIYFGDRSNLFSWLN